MRFYGLNIVILTVYFTRLGSTNYMKQAELNLKNPFSWNNMYDLATWSWNAKYIGLLEGDSNYSLLNLGVRSSHEQFEKKYQ